MIMSSLWAISGPKKNLGQKSRGPRQSANQDGDFDTFIFSVAWIVAPEFELQDFGKEQKNGKMVLKYSNFLKSKW